MIQVRKKLESGESLAGICESQVEDYVKELFVKKLKNKNK
jgi:hypothetical protein